MSNKTEKKQVAQDATRDIQTEELQFKPIEVNLENPTQLLEESIEKLDDHFGFIMFEDSVEGTDNLDPSRPAKVDRFLKNPDKKEKKKALKSKLQLWLNAILSSEDLSELVSTVEETSKKTTETYNKNLKIALDATRELETSYRTVGAFFSNAGDTADKVMFLNTDMRDVRNLDKSRSYDTIKEKLEETYNNFDLEKTIGSIVIPGYLGRKALVNKYGRLANEYKSLLVTDYVDADNFRDIKRDFNEDKLAGSDKYLSNIMMGAVYVQGRETADELGEEPLFVPPSAFIAGRLYDSHESSSTTVAQPVAGEKYGELYDAEQVRFNLKKSETGELESAGLIPIIKVRGKVVPMSARTLFNGDNIDYQQYSIVRIYDWVTKILIDYLNRKTFELFTASNRREVYGSIVKFLDELVRSGVIKKYSRPEIKQDPTSPDRVFVNVGITPLYATRAFHITLKGEKDNMGGG